MSERGEKSARLVLQWERSHNPLGLIIEPESYGDWKKNHDTRSSKNKYMETLPMQNRRWKNGA